MTDLVLRTILDHLQQQGIAQDRLVTNSREVGAGDIFLAYPGQRVDGRQFIPDAIRFGAAAIIWESEGFSWDPSWEVDNFPVAGLRQMAGHLAHHAFGRPSEKLWTIGVTGTNGKTSVTQWIARALAELERPCGVVGTLGIGFPNALKGSLNTTPEAIMLHRSFAELLQQNAEAVALEVSSIGLDQGRVNGVHFDIAVLTNLTRDHLDYHGDMAHYAKAKAALFDHEQLRHAVLNLDDPFGVHEARRLSGRGIEVIGYSLQADIATQNIPVDRLVVAENIRNTPMGQRLTVRCQGQAFELTVSLVGEFNIANLLAVIAVLIASEIHLEEAVAVAARLSPPSGRMQTLGGMGEPLVIVDYAHSPDALEKVLTAVRATVASRGGKLVCVFGCGGDRDPGKRPLMGQVACHHADKVVLTNDNPRSEDPSLILDEIAAGVCCDECAQVIVSRVPDRAQAIRQSIIEAGMDDVVVLAGKGHETYQEVHGERAPFSDVDEARRALAARFAPQGI